MASVLALAAYLICAWTCVIAARAIGMSWGRITLIGMLAFALPLVLTAWVGVTTAGSLVTEILLGLVLLLPAALLFSLVKILLTRWPGHSN